MVKNKWLLLFAFAVPLWLWWNRIFSPKEDPERIKNQVIDEHNNQSYLNLSSMINSDYWSPNYWKQFNPANIMTKASAEYIAERIYDSKGFFNDDEASVYSAIQTLKTKSQCSFLSDVMNQKYGLTVLPFLYSFMDNDELATVANITERLPSN